MSEEYSDEERDIIEKRVDAWYDAFARSGHFGQLTNAMKDDAKGVVMCFSDFMYAYEGQSPDLWSIAGMEQCCTETMPLRMTGDARAFESIGPVLSSFFRFLEDAGLLLSAGLLARRVEQLGPTIVQNGTNPSKWGPAKTFGMAAFAAGVDMSNREEIERFMVEYNRRLQGGDFSSNPMRALDFPSSPMADYTQSQRRQPTKAKRNMQKASRRKNRQ
ncbi:MAG: hypothetical protein H7839_21115 [Magnetococcus sp. YQC-5]